MTASRVTKSQKKQRLDWTMKKIDQGVGFSELASLVAETWGCSRRQARDVVAAVHAGRFFSAKRLNITFDAQNDAQNSGVRALSGASAKNALCIRLNDRGVGAAPIKDL